MKDYNSLKIYDLKKLPYRGAFFVYNCVMYEKDNKELAYYKNSFEIFKKDFTVNDIIKNYKVKCCSDFDFSDNEKSLFIENLLTEKTPFYINADSSKNINVLNNNSYFAILFSFIKNEFKLTGCKKLPELNGLLYNKLPDKYKYTLLHTEFNFYGYDDIVERVKDRVTKVDYMRLSDFISKDIILPFPYDYTKSNTFLEEHILEIQKKPRSIYVNSLCGHNIAYYMNSHLNYVISFMLGRNLLISPENYASFDDLNKDEQAEIKSIRVRVKYTENISDDVIKDFCRVKQNLSKTGKKPLFIY